MTVSTSNRKFLSIQDQISLLKSRGLIIASDSKVENFLTFKNYYNIINRYGQYYFDPNTQKFHPNTSFDNIVNLYFFDNDLKHIFYRKLMKFESHFKSVLAYVFSKNHTEEYSYLNPHNFDPNCRIDQISFIGNLTNHIKHNANTSGPDNPIKHHMTKYGHVPFWVLVNYMYLTDTAKFFKAMNLSEQNEIAKVFFDRYISEYSIVTTTRDRITPEQLDSFLRILNDFRNLTAHDNFLFGSKIKTLPKYCDCVYSPFGHTTSMVGRTLYDAFIIMRIFLEKKSYNNLHNKILRLLNKLKRQNSQAQVNNVLKAMGFPIDWNITSTIH